MFQTHCARSITPSLCFVACDHGGLSFVPCAHAHHVVVCVVDLLGVGCWGFVTVLRRSCAGSRGGLHDQVLRLPLLPPPLLGLVGDAAVVSHCRCASSECWVVGASRAVNGTWLVGLGRV